MPKQTSRYIQSPEERNLFQRFLPYTDINTATELLRQAQRPYSTAFLRNLRNKASQFGGGIGLGMEAQGTAGLESGLAAGVAQQLPQNFALASRLAPRGKEITETKSSFGEIFTGQILPRIGGAVVGGLTGGPLGALAGAAGGIKGAQLFSTLKEDSGPDEFEAMIDELIKIELDRIRKAGGMK